MNDFLDDDKFQREQRDKYLLPLFYKKRFNNFVFCDGFDHEQRRGIDTIVRIGNLRWTIDEKIVRKRYTAFALETKSCTLPGHEKPGWMFYGEADRLLYCFSITNGLECFIVDFPKLQTWFWMHEKTFPPFQMETRNRSFGRVVEVELVRQAGLVIGQFEVRS